ncbi:hypothetical protein P43SY_000426 [Pythium insidiosum]|uniref:Uncharacterized protein n=1 Tax=Pythium insidiosum TaxID=114742 RepID=A0AAD5M2H1_PYTIN|nr:hypothetical protein P43SY_000426 [Pythium insidiosum]
MTLAAGGISQSAIIERQAETIARLERHVEKANEYKTVTKVRLKEAAQRLREYRLRVEALQSELAATKDGAARLQRQLAAEKEKAQNARLRAPPPPPPKPPTRDAGVQTSSRPTTSTAVQTCLGAVMVAAGTQTAAEKPAALAESVGSKAPSLMDEISAEIEAALASSSDEGEEENETEDKRPTAAADLDAIARAIDAELELDSSDDDDSSSSNSSRAADENGGQSKPVDAISAAIDAELASSSDEDMDAVDPLAMLTGAETESSLALSMPANLLEPPEPAVSSATATATAAERAMDSISAAIDAELDMSDADDEETQVNEAPTAQVGAQNTPGDAGETRGRGALMDIVSAAVDAELETSDVDEEEKGDAAPVDSTEVSSSQGDDRGASAVAEALADSVSAAIDAELALSDAEEGDENEAATAPSKTRLRTFSLSSLDSDSDDSSAISLEAVETDESAVDGEDARAPKLEATEKSSVVCKVPAPSELASTATSQADNKAGATAAPTALSKRATDAPLDAGSAVLKASAIASIPAAAAAPLVRQDAQTGPGSPRPDSVALSPGKSKRDADQPSPHPPQGPTQSDDGESKHRTEVSTASPASAKRPVASSEDGETLAPSPKRPRVESAAPPPTGSAQAPASSTPSLVLPPQVLVVFKQAISLQDREKPDARFVMRTLGELLRRAVVGFVLAPERSERLARLLCDELRRRHIPPAVVLDGVVRVVHAPRTRRSGGRDIGAVARLFRLVLLGASGVRSSTDTDAAVDRWVQKLQELIVPRRFLVPGLSFFQAPAADSESATDPLAATEAALKLYAVVLKRAQGATPPVSSDKAILTYLCALHCELCRTRGAVAMVRVLALDVLKAYPSIKGLVLVRQLVEIWPRVLNVDDGADDPAAAPAASTLRRAMLEALVAITQRSTQRQELYLDQSALTMLSSIADALDLPTLLAESDHDDDDGAACATWLWRQAQAHTQADTQTASSVDDLAMALELTALVRGAEWVERHWAVAQWTGVHGADGDSCGRPPKAVARFIGSIARGLMQAPRAGHEGSSGEEAVAASIEWLFARLEATTVDGGDDVAVVATELVEVLLVLSSTWLQSTPASAAWLALQPRRPAWLGRLLEWTSRERLARHLSPRALRRLRLVVLSARPLGSATVSTTV